MAQIYEIEVYHDASGKSPFEDWFLNLKDKRAQARIQIRLDRLSLGHLGDHKPIKGTTGLYELRDHYGSGYRIYYSQVSNRLILLLAGSTKRDQDRAIAKAKKFLEDFHERTKNGT